VRFKSPKVSYFMMGILGCICVVLLIAIGFILPSPSTKHNDEDDQYSFDARDSALGSESATGSVSEEIAAERDSLMTGYDVR
jgi:hypothetical protein